MSNSNSGVRNKLREEEGRLVRQAAAEEREVSQEQRAGQAVSVDEASEAMVATEDGLALETVLDGALHDVRHALDYLNAGTYGMCEDCGQPIPAERLAARPQATLCVPCKTKREHGQASGQFSSASRAANAAALAELAESSDPLER